MTIDIAKWHDVIIRKITN